MLLTLKIVVDQETYERLVVDAVKSPRSIPQQAGVVLRRAYNLPPRTVVSDLKTTGSPDPRVPA